MKGCKRRQKNNNKTIEDTNQCQLQKDKFLKDCPRRRFSPTAFLKIAISPTPSAFMNRQLTAISQEILLIFQESGSQIMLDLNCQLFFIRHTSLSCQQATDNVHKEKSLINKWELSLPTILYFYLLKFEQY